MEFRRKRRRSLIINVTSLIDVLFLLLIFFMVSTTFLNTPAIKLELPKAQNAEEVRQEPLVIYVNSDGLLYLNDDPIERALLGAALENRLRGDADKAVILKADSRVSHGTVVDIMDVVKGAGARRLVVSTQPKE